MTIIVLLPLLTLLLIISFPTPGRSCKGKIDLIFCIDASGSVSTDEYNQQSDFVKQFVDTFSGNTANTNCDLPLGHAPNAGDGCGNFDGENGLKVGIMQFASGNDINLALSTDYQAIKTATARTENGETNTHLCLTAAQTMLTDTANGARAGASKIIVLLTDGSPSNSGAATNAANAAKAAGTMIIGVGVDTGHCYGKGICTPTPSTLGGCCSAGDTNIMALCTAPGTDHYTRVGDFNGLNSKIQAITDISCPIDCQGDWSDWTTCDKASGTQTRTFTVTKAAADGGTACPTTESKPCNVDCVFTYGPWQPTTCSSATATQTQKVQITQQSKNGGQACPNDNTRQCTSCQFTWGQWSTCGSNGMQSRSPTITSQPQNGGQACPGPETRTCATDCIFTYGQWSACDKMSGTQSRSPTITAQPQNGGKACPGNEQRPCLVNCEGEWGCWSSCTSPTIYSPPFTKKRKYVIQIYSKNGGNSCPTEETKSCVPDVCYSAESSVSSFGSKIMDLRPMQTLPPGHPGLSRTDCGGPVSSNDMIPTDNSNLQGHLCSGAPLLYYYDSTTGTSKSNLNVQDGASQLFFMQDSNAMLHFGLLNGSPPSTTPGNADFSFTFKDALGTNKLQTSKIIEWEVQNDISITNTAGCSATNDQDCYQFDTLTQRAKGKWSWSSNKNSGGILGPLPSYDFCISITAGDISGISKYYFGSYENNQWPLTLKEFDGSSFDHELKVCTYACPQPETCVEPTPGAPGNSGGTTGTTAGGTSGSTTTGTGTGSSSGSSGSSGSSSSNGSSGTSGGSQTTGTGSSLGGGGGDSSATPSASDVSSSIENLEENGASSDISGNGNMSASSGNNRHNDVGGNDGAGGLVGGLVGGLFGCVLLVIVVLFIKRRKENRSTMKDDKSLPPGWSSFIDSNTGHTCYVNDETGDTQWEHPDPNYSEVEMSTLKVENPMHKTRKTQHHSRDSTQLPDGWEKHTYEGDRFYQHEDGTTSWEAPEGSIGGSAGGRDEESMLASTHTRSETVLPPGWSKDESGADKYYYNDTTGETSWDYPEGSTKNGVAL